MKPGKTTAFLIAATFTLGMDAAALDKSKGVYRIPYANGTKVKVTNNHDKHKPKGRIDMHGTSGKPYKIVAAADGTVRYIVDNQSKQVDSKSGDPCTNNYVWIEHANGEWTKYSHMTKGSSTNKAKLKVGKFVKAGTYLGDEGKLAAPPVITCISKSVCPRRATPLVRRADSSRTIRAASATGFPESVASLEVSSPAAPAMLRGRFPAISKRAARRLPGTESKRGTFSVCSTRRPDQATS